MSGKSDKTDAIRIEIQIQQSATRNRMHLIQLMSESTIQRNMKHDLGSLCPYKD